MAERFHERTWLGAPVISVWVATQARSAAGPPGRAHGMRRGWSAAAASAWMVGTRPEGGWTASAT